MRCVPTEQVDPAPTIGSVYTDAPWRVPTISCFVYSVDASCRVPTIIFFVLSVDASCRVPTGDGVADTPWRVPTKVAMKHFILKLVFFIRIYFLCDRFYTMEGLYVISKYGNSKNVASDTLLFCQSANQ